MQYVVRAIFCVLLLGGGRGLQAQVITGRVVDAETSESLPGVTVSVRGTPDGAVTDSVGRYVLEMRAPGSYVLVAQALGYVAVTRRVALPAGQRTTVDFRLPPDVIELDQLEIVSDRLQEQRDPQPSVVSVEPEQARLLPGAAEDVLRALQAVPGVLAVNDFTAQLIVRGGGPDENLIILDDVEVFNPYRLYGVVSMFNPVVVSDITLTTGGFPARYGDRLSSVLDVETRAGTTARPFGGSLNTSISNTNVVLEGRTGLWDGSWLATGRRTYYDLILGLVARELDAIDGDVQFPNFADIQGKLVLRPARGHKLQFGSIFSRDALDLAVSGADLDTGSDADRLRADDLTRNDLVYGAWHWAPSARVFSKVTAGWYRNGGTFGSDGQLVPRDDFDGSQIVASADTNNVFEFAYQQRFRFRKWSLHQQTSMRAGRHFLELGAGLDLLNTTLRYALRLNDVGRAYFDSIQQNNPLGPGAFPERFDQGKSYYRYHVYAQDRIDVFDQRLFVQPGLRFDYYRIIDEAYLSPRLSLSYALDPRTTVRGSWGRYRQSPGFEKLIDQQQVYDLSEGAGIETLEAERATHYVLGLSRWLGERYQLRLEGYYKRFADMIVQQHGDVTRSVAEYDGSGARAAPGSYTLRRVTSPGLTARPVNEASGGALGLELVLEKRYLGSADRLSGWVAYAFARAWRSRTSLQQPGTRFQTPFDYDRTHVLNVAFNYQLGKRWELGVTFRYGTGFPFTPADGYAPVVVTRYQIDDPTAPPVAEVLTNSETGRARFQVLYGSEEQVNTARLPAYHRLDVRLTRALRLFGLDGKFYLDVINLYNHKNVLAYRYSVVLDGSQENPEPMIRREQTTMFPILPTLGFSFVF